MSHGLTSTDHMFSVRQVPWHGLGAVLDRRPASVHEALALSRLDWTVELSDLHLPGRPEPLADWRATVRSDTGTVLGIVSPAYEPVQNEEAFAFLAALIGSDAHWETAGSLWGGRQVWVLAKLPDHLEVGGDAVAQYMLVSTRHDGTGAVCVRPTEVRVVCQNTLRLAERKGGDVYRVRHLGAPTMALHEARAALQLTIDYGRQFKQAGDRLALEACSERTLRKVLAELYPDDTSLGGRAARSRTQARDAVMDLFRHGATVGNAPGSKWCAWNAVCEFHDYAGRPRSPQGAFVRRMDDPAGVKASALRRLQAA